MFMQDEVGYLPGPARPSELASPTSWIVVLERSVLQPGHCAPGTANRRQVSNVPLRFGSVSDQVRSSPSAPSFGTRRSPPCHGDRACATFSRLCWSRHNGSSSPACGASRRRAGPRRRESRRLVREYIHFHAHLVHRGVVLHDARILAVQGNCTIILGSARAFVLHHVGRVTILGGTKIVPWDWCRQGKCPRPRRDQGANRNRVNMAGLLRAAFLVCHVRDLLPTTMVVAPKFRNEPRHFAGRIVLISRVKVTGKRRRSFPICLSCRAASAGCWLPPWPVHVLEHHACRFPVP